MIGEKKPHQTAAQSRPGPEHPEIEPTTPDTPEIFPQRSPSIIPQRQAPEIAPPQPWPEITPQKSPDVEPGEIPPDVSPG